MPTDNVWRYESPENLRAILAWHELEAVSLRMTLEQVAKGNVVLLGDSPDGTCRFTAPEPMERPF